MTPDDPIEVIESVARAYRARWLVVERSDAARALAPVLAGTRPAWIGPPVFERRRTRTAGCRGSRSIPVCATEVDTRCE